MLVYCRSSQSDFFRLNILWHTLSLIMVAILNLFAILLKETHWKCALKLDEKRRLNNSVSHPENTKLQKFITAFCFLNKYPGGNFLVRAAAVIKGLQQVHILRRYCFKKNGTAFVVFLDIP